MHDCHCFYIGPWHPQQVRAAARDLIRAVGPGGGYCLGSNNTVTNYVPLDHFRAMVETALAYGHCPLDEAGGFGAVGIWVIRAQSQRMNN